MIPTAHPSPQLKRHLDRFSRFRTDDRRVSLYFTMGRPFPPQNCPFPWGIWTPSNTCFPGLTRVLNPNGISIGAAVFAGLTSVIVRQTDRQTERPRYSVGNNRPHPPYVGLRSTAMRSNNNREWRIINLTRLLVDAERLTGDAAAERPVIALHSISRIPSSVLQVFCPSTCYMPQLTYNEVFTLHRMSRAWT